MTIDSLHSEMSSYNRSGAWLQVVVFKAGDQRNSLSG